MLKLIAGNKKDTEVSIHMVRLSPTAREPRQDKVLTYLGRYDVKDILCHSTISRRIEAAWLAFYAT